MEHIKENYKEIIRINKESRNINLKLKEINKLTYGEIENKKNEIIKLNNKRELNKIKVAILKNNIHYLLKMSFEGIKQDILNIYDTKNIGEKTKEKIKNQIIDYYKNNFNIDNLTCYVSTTSNYSGPSGLQISFDFLDKEGYKSWIFEYQENFEINFNKYSYNEYKTQINYYNNINEYIPIKDINKKAKELQKDYIKTVEKIEKIRLQQKELYHNFRDYLQGCLIDQFKIDYKIDISY